MKLKRWHLYVIVGCVFCVVFVYINQKYDRFFRVNGINNDNRALIEQYLDEEEQQYLVDNGISVKEFIDYIQEPEFYLPYYQFYNELKLSKKYNSNQELIHIGNTIAKQLDILYGEEGIDYCKTLIKNNLMEAFMVQDDFDFANIPYYQILRTIYSDTSYVTDMNQYLTILKADGITSQKTIVATMESLCEHYSQTTLFDFMNAKLATGITRNYHVSRLTTVINPTTYIGGYEPSNIVMVSVFPRATYSMYLTKDAAEALSKMYDDMIVTVGNDCILLSAYRGYDVLNLSSDNTLELAGYSEYQLGTTIRLFQQDMDFANTPYYTWLLENSYKYGYILRYPADKVDVTGVENQLNVFRYVGVELATQLHENNLALEQIDLLEE